MGKIIINTKRKLKQEIDNFSDRSDFLISAKF